MPVRMVREYSSRHEFDLDHMTQAAHGWEIADVTERYVYPSFLRWLLRRRVIVVTYVRPSPEATRR